VMSLPNIPGTITRTSSTVFYSTRQFFTSPDLNDHEFPPLVQDLLHMFGHVDYLACRNNLVIPLDVSIIQFLVPEAVLCLSVFVIVVNLIAIRDATFPAQRRQRTGIGMHRGKDQSSVGNLALNVSRTIVPIDAESINRVVWVVTGVQKFHNSGQVVRLARRFAY